MKYIGHIQDSKAKDSYMYEMLRTISKKGGEFDIDVSLSTKKYVTEFPKENHFYIIHFSDTDQKAVDLLRLEQPFSKLVGILSGGNADSKLKKGGVYQEKTRNVFDKIIYSNDYKGETYFKDLLKEIEPNDNTHLRCKNDVWKKNNDLIIPSYDVPVYANHRSA